MRAVALVLLACLALGAEILVPGTDFPIPQPSGWKSVVDPGATLVLVSPDGQLRLAVTVQTFSEETGPAVFAKRNLADLQRLLTGIELKDWNFGEQHHGQEWSRVRYRFVLGEQTYEQSLWMTTRPGLGYCLTLGGPANHPGLDQAIRTFEADLWGSRTILR